MESKEYKVGPNGLRGMRVNMPPDFARYAGLDVGSTIRFVYDTDAGRLELALISKPRKGK